MKKSRARLFFGAGAVGKCTDWVFSVGGVLCSTVERISPGRERMPKRKTRAKVSIAFRHAYDILVRVIQMRKKD